MFKLTKFSKNLVTRKTSYPFDVVVRSAGMIIMISEEKYRPPGRIVTSNFYREWSYGEDWKIAIVPGEVQFEMILAGHAERNGEAL